MRYSWLTLGAGSFLEPTSQAKYWLCMHTHIYIHIHMWTHVHTYTYMYIDIYIYIHTYVLFVYRSGGCDIGFMGMYTYIMSLNFRDLRWCKIPLSPQERTEEFELLAGFFCNVGASTLLGFIFFIVREKELWLWPGVKEQPRCEDLLHPCTSDVLVVQHQLFKLFRLLFFAG